MKKPIITNMHNPHTLAYYQDKLAPMHFRQDTAPIITGAGLAKAFTVIKRYPGEKGVVETYVR